MRLRNILVIRIILMAQVLFQNSKQIMNKQTICGLNKALVFSRILQPLLNFLDNKNKTLVAIWAVPILCRTFALFIMIKALFCIPDFMEET